MPSKKQLEALARGRATMAKNRANKTDTVKARKKTVRKNPVTPLTSKISTRSPARSAAKTTYGVRVELTDKRVGYLNDWLKTGPTVDSDVRKAMLFNTYKHAHAMSFALYTARISGVRSVETVILSAPSSKKK